MKWPKLAMMACATCLMSGCATVTKNSCDWAQPIRPSIEDHLTDGTARQILEHNLTGQAVCGWRP